MKKLFLALALISAPAVADDWQTLDASQWRAYKGEGIPAGWHAEGNTLSMVKSPAGDIVSKETYGSFELTFEWKISAGGNSGVFFHVQESPDLAQTYFSGPEYQVLDNKGRSEPPIEQAGGLYILYAPEADYTKPVGEFNEGRILVDGSKVEHWLNGHKVAAYDMASDDFKARVAASKFAKWPAFAASPSGHIALQDHGDPVTYRNIRIRRLSAE
ncbi:3-keto-disaccharide hydrolase [Pseudokordiimonas caeni]|uniref:3-keto-disaccharide hydrolase n=1 Tax=Pseudokordiimonas caeni TaxID=2997908 RepID=UPI0028119927|nr:DUF1080 domain-containing protein [Pseudokordiimonas caeni]